MTERLPNLLEEEREDLNSPSQKEFNFRPYFRTFLRKAWLIAGTTGVTTFAGLILSVQDPPTYVGNFYLLVEAITSSAKLTNHSALARTEGISNKRLFDESGVFN